MRPGVLLVAIGVLAGCGDEVIGFAQQAAASTTDVSASSSGATETSSSTDAPDPSTGSSSSTGSASQGPPDLIAYGFDEGMALSFDDGATWVEVEDPDTTNDAREGIAAGEDRIVLVGAQRSMMTFDGLSWTEQTWGSSLGYARDVAYGSGGFASVGLGHVIWSWDGENWEDARGGATTFDLVAIAYGGGRFVATGVDIMATSENGQDWVFTDVPGEKLHTVAYGDGRFVAVGELGRVLETANGVDVLRDVPSGLGGLGHIRFCQDVFVVAAGSRLWQSADADAWSEVITNGDTLACTETTWVTLHQGTFYRGDTTASLMPVHVTERPLYELAYTPISTD